MLTGLNVRRVSGAGLAIAAGLAVLVLLAAPRVARAAPLAVVVEAIAGDASLLPCDQMPAAGQPACPQPQGGQPLPPPRITFGDVLHLLVCVPEKRRDDAGSLRLVLGGVTLPVVPAAEHRGPCRLAGDGAGARVALGFPVNFAALRPENWVLAFAQRDRGGLTTATLLDAQGAPVILVSAAGKPAPPPVILFLRHPWWPVAAALAVVAGFALLLWRVDKGQMALRERVYCRKTYLRRRLDECRAAKAKADARRGAVTADLLSRGISDADSRIEALLGVETYDRERIIAALVADMTNVGIMDGRKPLDGLLADYQPVWEAEETLRQEFAAAGLAIADPFADPPATAQAIAALVCRAPFSLARVQMAWWTGLVLFSFVFMYLTTWTEMALSADLLWLMGISGGTFATAVAVANRDDALPKALPAVTTGTMFRDILTDPSGQDTFYRWQMVCWTLLLGLVFIVTLFRSFVAYDFDATLLGLMGLSSSLYVGFKWQERPAT